MSVVGVLNNVTTHSMFFFFFTVWLFISIKMLTDRLEFDTLRVIISSCALKSLQGRLTLFKEPIPALSDSFYFPSMALAHVGNEICVCAFGQSMV